MSGHHQKKKTTKNRWKHAKNEKSCTKEASFRYVVTAELSPDQRPAAVCKKKKKRRMF